MFALSYGRVVIYNLRKRRENLVFLSSNCGNFAISSIVLVIFFSLHTHDMYITYSSLACGTVH